jgi:hypothetical protein
MRTPAIASLLALCAGCSLLFDSSAGSGADGIFPKGKGPVLRYDFEGSSDTPIVSTGSDNELELSLLGGATRTDGALQLPQPNNDFDLALSVQPAMSITTQCPMVKSLTVAAWVTPRGTSPLESTPARIVSIENLDASRTSMTLGQFDRQNNYNGFVFRLGSTQQIEAMPADFDPDVPLFLFFTIDLDGRYRFQVGDRDPEQDIVGDLTELWDWDADNLLSVGGSNNNRRPFQGKIHHVEIFCRVLDSEERELLKNHTDPR